MAIHLSNRSSKPFSGWARVTVPLLEPTSGLFDGGVHFVRGPQIGPDVHVVDVNVTVPAGADLEVATKVTMSPGVWKPTPNGFALPGVPRVNGEPMVFIDARIDGAFYRGRFRRRIGPLLLAELLVYWTPGEPYAHGTVTLTASNSSVPDVYQYAPSVALTWGDAVVHVLGRGFGGQLTNDGEMFGDGQARILPVTFGWLSAMQFIEQLNTSIVIAGRALLGTGLDVLYPEGNPRQHPQFVAEKFGELFYNESLRRLHTWDVGTLGVNKRSEDTGAQEDQVVHGEAMMHPVAGAVNYLAALKWANRPCHHRDWRGDIIKAADHPGVMLWDGRPHFAAPDHLGKSVPLREPNGTEPEGTNGWWGPDEEHWLVGRLFEAVRLTGDGALQDELVQEAERFLFACTLPVGSTATWFTSGPGAARAIGWKGVLVHRLWFALEDRTLAQRVLDRWAQFLELVLLPRFENRDVWDVRVNDDRLGQGEWWMPWQQAVGAYGVMLATQLLSEGELRKRGLAMALIGAAAVLRDGFVMQPDGWHTRPQRPVGAPSSPTDKSFNHFGMPLAIATMLTLAPQHDEARTVWEYLLSTADSQDKLKWMPPISSSSPTSPA